METANVLYYGDNLDILRHHIADESVDLIYLDPPFNSSRNYNVLFRETNGTDARSQIRAFEDSWTWDRQAVETLEELTQTAPAPLVDLLNAFVPFLGRSPMTAYLVMMGIRLLELRRVLKPTGSIYLHCDPTASHYLKTLMDGIFGPKNFRNEIVWHYRRWTAPSRKFQCLHDVVLFYSKENTYTFNQLLIPYTSGSVARKEQGVLHRFKKGEEPVLVSNREVQSDGVPENDVWQIPFIAPSAKERLGYPTQKPLALLERIIQASSNEGDLVLDPFCGCGTTVDASQHLGRRWIGIDITHIAISLIRRRLQDRYREDVQFEVVGEPKDQGSARALAEQDRYQFQSWALDQIDARPAQEVKGADRGIDGITFFCDDGENIRRAIVQVKSGHVTVGLIRDLVGTLKRENDDKERTPIGIFLTLEQPTKPMIQEAVSGGFYQHPLILDKKFLRIQILTVRDLFEGKNPDLPHSQPLTYTKAGAAPKMKTQERLKL